MALVIRLRQQGRTNRQSYRLVVANKRSPRDGKYVEKLGWYDPFAKDDKNLFIEEKKLFDWLNKGAILSEKARSLVMRLFPDQMKKLEEAKRAKKISRKKKPKKVVEKKAEPKKAKKETKETKEKKEKKEKKPAVKKAKKAEPKKKK